MCSFSAPILVLKAQQQFNCYSTANHPKVSSEPHCAAESGIWLPKITWCQGEECERRCLLPSREGFDSCRVIQVIQFSISPKMLSLKSGPRERRRIESPGSQGILPLPSLPFMPYLSLSYQSWGHWLKIPSTWQCGWYGPLTSGFTNTAPQKILQKTHDSRTPNFPNISSWKYLSAYRANGLDIPFEDHGLGITREKRLHHWPWNSPILAGATLQWGVLWSSRNMLQSDMTQLSPRAKLFDFNNKIQRYFQDYPRVLEILSPTHLESWRAKY